MLTSPFGQRRSPSARHQLLACLIVVALLLVTLPFDRFVSLPIYRTAHAAAFAPGNLVVYRVGSGTGSLLGTGNPVFLDEFTPAGSLVQSIALPTADSLPNQSLIANGTSTSEGFLTRSADGQYLVLTGYDVTPPAAATVNTTASSTVNRVIGRVDTAGTINTTTALSDAFSGGNIRSVSSTDGNTFWATGSNDGVRTTTLGSTTSTVVASNVTNLRQTNIFNNQLYVSSGAGTTRVATVGTGTSTATGQTITNIPGIPTTNSPYGFFFADLDAGVAGVDTLYVADDTAFALRKYSLVGGTWTLNGTIGADSDDYRGLTATVSGTTVTLYATRKGGSGAAGGGELVSLVDATGYNGAFSGTPTLLSTAVTNTAFRGVALAPATLESEPSVSSTTPTNGATNVALAANISINFSEPVNVTSNSFTISCATSGTHTFALGGSSASYSLDPDSDFVNSELCTVTVVANQVTDVDASDPPDNMAADYVFTFTTVSATPTLSISDVTQVETNSGTTTFNFNVSLSAPAGAGGVSFTVDTADGTTNPANAGSDYVAIVGGSGSITSGNSSTTVSVTVNGDTTPEPNETFFVNLTSITGATAGDVQGLGTITNDDVTLVPIHTIQGSGTASPFANQSVTTTGIVTGRKSNGFFIQEPDAGIDSDPNTSEGVFVFTSSAPPAAATIGNLVQVTGTVSEFIPSQDLNSTPLTELTSPTTVQLSTGNPLPAPIAINAAETTAASETTRPLDTLEEYEGMRVTVASLTVIAPTQGNIDENDATSTSNGVFYGVVTGVARPFREPGVNVSDALPAGAPANVPRFDENTEKLRVDSDAQPGASAINVTTGTVITNMTGPLDFGFRTYTILPDAASPHSVGTLATFTAVPVPTASEFTIASLNAFHFFDTNDDPGVGDVVLTATAFNNRLNKISLLIRNVMRTPDVIGVQEFDNVGTLQSVATRVNNDVVTGGGTNPNYQPYLVEGSDIGGIDVGFLVKASRVTVVDVTQEGKTATFTNPNNGQQELLNDRPPLVLRATVARPGGGTLPFTVIVNHLRSLIDVEADNDAGRRTRAKRQAGAVFLANLIQARQTANPSEAIISVGDMNAFQFNDGYADVIGTIKGTPSPDDQTVVLGDGADLVNPNLTNLVDAHTVDQRYSYTFDGQAQVLDHIIVNDDALAINTRFAYGRNNADFPTIYYGDSARPERMTDHDPPVAYFNIAPAANTPPTANAQSVTTAENTPVAITLTGSDPDGNPLTFAIVSGPANGTLNPGTSGASQTYTPTAGYTGADSFTFKVNDGTADSAPATVSITVNDGGALQFSSATYNVNESAGSATITITRTGGNSGTATVLFSTSNGTAGSSDYTSVSQTVTFNEFDLSKTVSVPITNDSLNEANETVNLALSVPGGSGQLGSPVAAVLTIVDDDPAGGIIRFTSATYDTTESSGFTTITVERVGDTSQAASVDYATSDDSGASPVVPCATAGSNASSRCDFITALGTLRFAAGEGSKTFTVLISQDNFVENLEGLGLTLSNPTAAAVLGTPSSATLRITDDASEPAANPIEDAGVFVRMHYHDFLNREADASGLAFWTDQIISCGADVACREIRRINVSAAFFLSVEFQESGTFVRNFYVAALNRSNNLPRYLEFMRDTQAVQRGVIIGEPNALTILEANKQAFALDFVTRAEFVGLYPTTATPTQYVDALYLHAGVTPSASERQAAIDEFAGAGTSADTGARARALRRIIQNSAFAQREFPRAFVQMQYFGYLRRNPDDQPDGNLSGYNFWLNKLNQFNGNFIQAEMVKAFITSDEYRRRFGQ